MMRIDAQKQEIKERFGGELLGLESALDDFGESLKDPDIVCIDTPTTERLKVVRNKLLQMAVSANPVIDEGIKSTSAQSVSGRLIHENNRLWEELAARRRVAGFCTHTSELTRTIAPY